MTSDFRILAMAESELWKDAWRKLPLAQRDVFLRPEYYAAWKQGDAVAECAVFEEDEALILYPFFRRPIHALPELGIDRPSFDLEVAYGYGGPVSNSASESAWGCFFEKFSAWCRSVGVVAEFIRLHPLNANRGILERQYQLAIMNQNVVVDVGRSDEEIWRSYKHSTRKNINKARRSGVEVFAETIPAAHFDDYMRIYSGTMERRQARESYRFPPLFYATLHQLMPDGLVYFFARSNCEIVSCELCLLSETTIYSFLGGTVASAFELRPNNLLKHEVIRWARERGLGTYVLGGGSRLGDGIFEYKKSFAPAGVVDFYVAKRVHDPEMYSLLLKRCDEASDPDTSQSNQWFLRWRYEA